jgi:hypothetical protein
MKRPFTGGMLRFSDYVGTASFAITGCLTASSVGMDVLGCTIVGTITAVGGGTVRDVLLGKGKRLNRSRSGAQWRAVVPFHSGLGQVEESSGWMRRSTCGFASRAALSRSSSGMRAVGPSVMHELAEQRYTAMPIVSTVHAACGACHVSRDALYDCTTGPRAMQTAGFSEDDAWVWWSDTLGVGAFAVIGTMNGIRAGVPLLCCAICGMFTSTFGGLIRDVLPACSFSPSLPLFLRLYHPPAPATARSGRSRSRPLAHATGGPFAVLRIVRLQ